MQHSLEEIASSEAQLRLAMLDNDLAALERLLHDELVFTDFTGAVVSKQEDLATHVAGAIHIAELEFVETPVMKLYGEMAIVAVKARLTGVFHGTPFANDYRYLRVWIFQEGSWRVVAGNLSIVT